MKQVLMSYDFVLYVQRVAALNIMVCFCALENPGRYSQNFPSYLGTSKSHSPTTENVQCMHIMYFFTAKHTYQSPLNVNRHLIIRHLKGFLAVAPYV